jgi:hypothetical protein
MHVHERGKSCGSFMKNVKIAYRTDASEMIARVGSIS